MIHMIHIKWFIKLDHVKAVHRLKIDTGHMYKNESLGGLIGPVKMAKQVESGRKELF